MAIHARTFQASDHGGVSGEAKHTMENTYKQFVPGEVAGGSAAETKGFHQTSASAVGQGKKPWESWGTAGRSATAGFPSAGS